jgi:hypothetical protein
MFGSHGVLRYGFIIEVLHEDNCVGTYRLVTYRGKQSYGQSHLSMTVL